MICKQIMCNVHLYLRCHKSHLSYTIMLVSEHLIINKVEQDSVLDYLNPTELYI